MDQQRLNSFLQSSGYFMNGRQKQIPYNKQYQQCTRRYLSRVEEQEESKIGVEVTIQIGHEGVQVGIIWHPLLRKKKDGLLHCPCP